MCGREFSWGFDGVGKGTACGGGFALGAGGIYGMLFGAGQSEVVEPRWAVRGGGDGPSRGDGETADAVNPKRATKR